eukprot:TRINITY_DN2258_c0_g1_i10.p1 TRINITY_DN2258_c0_g1~~TRINITY_DN2258_c0_g1_i10.p1  ORF type:complete len:206 (-),score=27.65 TRINITY_DN2258_c0_g1_i10:14-631(-)
MKFRRTPVHTVTCSLSAHAHCDPQPSQHSLRPFKLWHGASRASVSITSADRNGRRSELRVCSEQTKQKKIVGFLAFWLGTLVAVVQSAAQPVAAAAVPSGYEAVVWASGLGSPRGIFADPNNGDILVMERSQRRITLFWGDRGDGLPQGNVTLVGGLPGASSNSLHAVLVHNGFLYFSNNSAVMRSCCDYCANLRGYCSTVQTVR